MPIADGAKYEEKKNQQKQKKWEMNALQFVPVMIKYGTQKQHPSTELQHLVTLGEGILSKDKENKILPIIIRKSEEKNMIN